ncbi:MAG: hypothetical protein K6U80_11725 [Firmicutes bacterium]|nr:hypothetical protein [Bacillota bacterium]
MLQLKQSKILNPDWRRIQGGINFQFPFPRYICSQTAQAGASCTNTACAKPESNRCCLFCQETCDNECPEKKLNPEFIKEVGLLYRTGGLPFYNKKPVRPERKPWFSGKTNIFRS